MMQKCCIFINIVKYWLYYSKIFKWDIFYPIEMHSINEKAEVYGNYKIFITKM